MAERTRVAFQAVVWFAAANFAALLVAAVVVFATGAVDASRAGRAVDVLRGVAEAVPAEDLAALKDAREKLEGRRDEATLMKSWAEFYRERSDFYARRKQETDTLFTLRDEARRDLGAITSALSELKAKREEEARKRDQEKEELRQSALDKVRRVYKYMRPEEVARDLEVRLEEDRADEVAELIRAMNDRAAAEVLGAMTDPARRMQVYDALAGIRTAAKRP